VSLGGPVDPERSMRIGTYENHKFVIQLSPHIPGVETIFKKGKGEEEVFMQYNADSGTITALTAQQEESIQRSVRIGREMAERHKGKEPVVSLQQPRHIRNTSDVVESVDLAMAHCSSQRGDNFTACLASNLIDDFDKHKAESAVFSDIYSSMASRLRNYTCGDSTMQTSTPIASYDVSLPDRDVTVNVLLNKTSSKIWLVDNFVSDEECDILQNTARPLLSRATVAGPDGRPTLSEHRKANQARYDVANDTDPLW